MGLKREGVLRRLTYSCSTMNTSFKTLRDYSKTRLEILNQLHDAGIEQEIDLPQIVAVGNQSVSKSSLMETISTLKLSRGSGTVTKHVPNRQRSEPCLTPSTDVQWNFASSTSRISLLSRVKRTRPVSQQFFRLERDLPCNWQCPTSSEMAPREKNYQTRAADSRSQGIRIQRSSQFLVV
ncbi:hypothetical protein K438DRAFT_956149 [Mycena galopus ATCC 62051]|nr:hypothetical protein K438DRAFT_956149 [Mycena galopus ATCC 62051]